MQSMLVVVRHLLRLRCYCRSVGGCGNVGCCGRFSLRVCEHPLRTPASPLISVAMIATVDDCCSSNNDDDDDDDDDEDNYVPDGPARITVWQR